MRPVKSECVEAVDYSAPDRRLRIRFSGGRTYDYIDVPPSTFSSFQAAESKGKFVNQVVKQKYRYREIR